MYIEYYLLIHQVRAKSTSETVSWLI